MEREHANFNKIKFTEEKLLTHMIIVLIIIQKISYQSIWKVNAMHDCCSIAVCTNLNTSNWNNFFFTMDDDT